MRRHLNTLLAGAALLALPLAAHATLVVTPSNIPQIDDNVISNGCASQIDGPALTIQGCMSQSHSTLVSFTANENIKFAAAGGLDMVQARIQPFTLKIEVVGHTFKSLIFDTVETSKPGDISFTDGTNSSGFHVFCWPAGPPSCFGSVGENNYTITDSGGGSFDFISFTTTSNGSDDIITHIQNVRIGGIDPPPVGDAVPEPASIALLGVGLLGLGTIVQRRRNRAFGAITGVTPAV